MWGQGLTEWDRRSLWKGVRRARGVCRRDSRVQRPPVPSGLAFAKPSLAEPSRPRECECDSRSRLIFLCGHSPTALAFCDDTCRRRRVCLPRGCRRDRMGRPRLGPLRAAWSSLCAPVHALARTGLQRTCLLPHGRPLYGHPGSGYGAETRELWVLVQGWRWRSSMRVGTSASVRSVSGESRSRCPRWQACCWPAWPCATSRAHGATCWRCRLATGSRRSAPRPRSVAAARDMSKRLRLRLCGNFCTCCLSGAGCARVCDGRGGCQGRD